MATETRELKLCHDSAISSICFYTTEYIRTIVRIKKHMKDVNGALAHEPEPSDDKILHWLPCQCLTLPALSLANRHSSRRALDGSPFITWLRMLYGTSCSSKTCCPSRTTSLKSAMSPREVTYHVTDTPPSDFLLNKNKQHYEWHILQISREKFGGIHDKN